jgi:replicative superfamily II helicase
MAYKTEHLFNTAMEQINKNKLFFIEDIIAFMPCAKSTFYEHFPNDSNYYKKMFEALEKNRTELKVSLRSKWYKSNAPALQMALMKLIASPEELRKLSMQYNDHTTAGEKINQVQSIQVEILNPNENE